MKKIMSKIHERSISTGLLDPLAILPKSALDLILQHLQGLDVMRMFEVTKIWNESLIKSPKCMEKIQVKVIARDEMDLSLTKRAYVNACFTTSKVLENISHSNGDPAPSTIDYHFNVLRKLAESLRKVEVMIYDGTNGLLDIDPDFQLQIEELSLRLVSDEQLKFFWLVCGTNLHKLAVDNLYLDDDFGEVLSKNSKLTELDILGCEYGFEKNIGEKIFALRLETLRIKTVGNHCYHKDKRDNDFTKLLITSQKNCVLTFCYSVSIDDHDINEVKWVLSNLHNMAVLRKLVLHDVPLQIDDDLNLKAIKSLKEFDDFHNIFKISKETLLRLAPNIEILYTEHVTKADLTCYREKFKSLDEIVVGSNCIWNHQRPKVFIRHQNLRTTFDILFELSSSLVNIDLIFQHFKAVDLIRASEVSHFWHNLTANSEKCMSKIWMRINDLNHSAVQQSKRKYQNIILRQHRCKYSIDLFLSKFGLYLQSIQIIGSEDGQHLFFPTHLFPNLKNVAFVRTVTREDHFCTRGCFIYLDDPGYLNELTVSEERTLKIMFLFNNLLAKKLVIKNVWNDNKNDDHALKNNYVTELDLTASGCDLYCEALLIRGCPNLELLHLNDLTKDKLKLVKANNKKLKMITYRTKRFQFDDVLIQTTKLKEQTIDPLVILPEVLHDLLFQHFRGREPFESSIRVSEVSKTWYEATRRSKKFLRNFVVKIPCTKLDLLVTKRIFTTFCFILQSCDDSEMFLKALNDHSRSLINLNVKNIDFIDNKKFSSVDLPNLKYLELDSTYLPNDSNDPIELTQYLQKFICFDLVHLYLVNFKLDIAQVLVLGRFLQLNEKLKYLYLDGVGDLRELFKSEISTQMKFQLTYLRFSLLEYCSIDSRTSKNLCSFLNSQAETLETIDLTHVTNEMVDVIFSKCRNLKEFRFTKLSKAVISTPNTVVPSKPSYLRIDSLNLLEIPFSFRLKHFKPYLDSAPNLSILLVTGLSEEILEYAHKNLKHIGSIVYDNFELDARCGDFSYENIKVRKEQIAIDAQQRIDKRLASRNQEVFNSTDLANDVFEGIMRLTREMHPDNFEARMGNATREAYM